MGVWDFSDFHKINFKSQRNRFHNKICINLFNSFSHISISFPGGSVCLWWLSQPCRWKPTARSPASLISREFSVPLDLGTAFHCFYSVRLSSQPLETNPMPHFMLVFWSTLLIFLHYHNNVYPWFILSSSLVQDTGWGNKSPRVINAVI